MFFNNSKFYGVILYSNFMGSRIRVVAGPLDFIDQSHFIDEGLNYSSQGDLQVELC